MKDNGFDFFGPRTSYKVKNMLSTFQNNCVSKMDTNQFNYDLYQLSEIKWQLILIAIVFKWYKKYNS
jgi:hypothetical protein